VRVGARGQVLQAGLEVRERQVLEHLERTHRVERDAGRQRGVELGDVGDVVDVARGVDVDGLDRHAGVLEVAPEHAGAGADLEHGARADREHRADLVPVRDPPLEVVLAL